MLSSGITVIQYQNQEIDLGKVNKLHRAYSDLMSYSCTNLCVCVTLCDIIVCVALYVCSFDDHNHDTIMIQNCAITTRLPHATTLEPHTLSASLTSNNY